MLKRVLGLKMLILYGVGDILGAGIYALVGKVAAEAGSYTWLAFVIAMFAAGLTALAYAELGGRYPHSAGAANFVGKAFDLSWLSTLIGWMVLWSGVVSMATVSRALVGYFQGFWPGIPVIPGVAVFLGVLGLITFRGMKESSIANAICTTIEVGGLIIVIAVGGWYLLGPQDVLTSSANHVSTALDSAVMSLGLSQTITVTAILSAAALAFFAFIGFEDLVNMAEEVHEPHRNIPKAIIGALLIAGTIYILISIIATQVITPAELAAAKAPLMAVVTRVHPGFPAFIFSVIAMFAVSNTALANYVMGSRLLYGMSHHGLIPKVFGRAHGGRHTPHVSIIVIFFVALILAVSGDLAWLAGTTSMLLLLVFMMVHVALYIIKRRDSGVHTGFHVPAVIPIVGAVSCFGLVFYVSSQAKIVTGIIVALGLLLIAIGRMRKGTGKARAA